MANQTGRPIAPARKLVAAVMGTIAVFVMALGLGMSSWGVVLFGLAVLVLSIALGMVNVVRRGARAWVTGTAEVRAISPPPTSSAVYGRAEIQAVVVAPGLPTSEVTIREPRVPVVKWPMIGDTLPITVDVDDMRRVRINWDDASPRDKGADPPPPHMPDYGELPDEVVDDLDDDLLGDVDPPPWTTPDRQWDEPPPPPPGAGPDVPVVVRDTPAGPVVEGELVHHDEEPPPLPRRAAAGSGAEPAGGPGAWAESAPGAAPGSWTAADAEPAEAGSDGPGSGGQGSGGQGSAGPGSAEPGSAEPGSAGQGSGAPGSGGSRSGGVGPGEAGTATTAGAAAAAGAYAGSRAGASAGTGGGAGRPAGSRPSPRPRGGAATATADPVAEAPPAPRAPQDEALPVDVPLDDPVDDDLMRYDEPAGSDADDEPPWRRPEPTVAATAAEPSPVTSFPRAPEPMGPPPAAPEPSTPRPSVPEPRAFDDIDLPLDGDPPEATSPGAPEAVDDGLIAPPVEEPAAPTVEEPAAPTVEEPAAPTVEEPAPPPVEEPAPAAVEEAPAPERRTTKFMSNAAHDEEAGAGAGSPGVIAGAAAAAGAVAAAAVAAVKKFGHSDKRAEDSPEPPAEPAPPAEPVPPAEPEPSAKTEPRAQDEPGATTETAAGSERGPENPWAAPPPVGVEADEHADELITAYPSARPGPAGAIYGVGITVLVTDLARSIAFYRDTLGFYEIDNGDGSAVLASGDTRLVLRTVSELSAEAGRLIFLNLEVGDVEAVYAELIEKGVRFVHPPQPVNRGERLELWSATFLDPDDHNIAITQWRAIR